jgi:3-oxoadipate enol-lactonase
MGGLVAARVAAQRPDLVRSLVLASCYVTADERIREVTARWRELARTAGMEDLYEACLDWVFSPAYVTANREEMDKLKTFFRLTVQDPASFCQQSLAGVRYDGGPDLARVRCPALVLHGDADRLVAPERGRELAAALPSARLAVLPGAAHFLSWEHAGRFNHEVLGFLRAVATQDGGVRR